MRFFYDAAENLEVLAQPGTPLAFPCGDVHQLDSEERNLLSAYTAPDRSRAPYVIPGGAIACSLRTNRRTLA